MAEDWAEEKIFDDLKQRLDIKLSTYLSRMRLSLSAESAYSLNISLLASAYCVSLSLTEVGFSYNLGIPSSSL